MGGGALVAILLLPHLATGAAQSAGQTWPERKCELYRTAWTQYLARRGAIGLGPDFVARHEAFLASGCTGPHDVCPVSPPDYQAANDMTVLAMNNGMASTFPPFGCKR